MALGQLGWLAEDTEGAFQWAAAKACSDRSHPRGPRAVYATLQSAMERGGAGVCDVTDQHSLVLILPPTHPHTLCT